MILDESSFPPKKPVFLYLDHPQLPNFWFDYPLEVGYTGIPEKMLRPAITPSFPLVQGLGISGTQPYVSSM